MPLEIVRAPSTRRALVQTAPMLFGNLIKGVVDVRRRIMAIGGELHSDEEAALLEDGSSQEDLWGINLYPSETGEEWIEYDSMINLRPSQGNRSRGIDDANIRAQVRLIVLELVSEAG